MELSSFEWYLNTLLELFSIGILSGGLLLGDGKLLLRLTTVRYFLAICFYLQLTLEHTYTDGFFWENTVSIIVKCDPQ